MSSSAVTPTWAISQTATDAIGISKGIIAAATSDNVQPIALLACEGFGATLLRSLETCVKAQIGFCKGDSGWQLSQSDAGLRFLSLAACLLTVDWWRAAEMLQLLLREHAADKRLIPTSQQLKHLFGAIDYRLACSGFADDVVGWNILLEKPMKAPNITISPPSSGTLRGLIASLSDLERLGEAHSVHINTGINEGAWIIAFVKWCLGTPPTVITPNDTQNLLQENAHVFIYLRTDNGQTKGTTIATKSVIDGVNELWENLPTGNRDFDGMVRLSTFASRLLNRLGNEQSLKRQAGYEAIKYGCGAVLDRLRCTTFPNIPQELDLRLAQSTVFPDEEIIASSLANFLGQSPTFTLERLPDNALVQELPPVAVVLRQLEATCECLLCLKRNILDRSSCKCEHYLQTISECIAAVFLISLLVPNDLHAPFLHYSASQSVSSEEFVSAVYHCLRFKGIQTCHVEEIRQNVMELVGHLHMNGADQQCIMSAHRGQSIYPQIWGDLNLPKTGFLNMVCVPGLIMYREEKYKYVESPGESTLSSGVPEWEAWNFEDIASDRYKDSRILWQVSAQEDRLSLTLAAPDLPGLPERNPMEAIRASPNLFFINCAHDRNAPVPTKAQRLAIADSVAPRIVRRGGANQSLEEAEFESKFEAGVVFCGPNERMRFFALCDRRRCVVREDACIECCFEACKVLRLRGIIS